MLRRFADADVLLVDDNPANITLLRAILERAGLQHLRAYTDPREAVGTLDHPPDLALIDLHMPHLDGYAVLDELVDHAAGTYLPTVVLTADPSPEALRRALQRGAQDFVTKPFDATEVVLRVRNLLQTGSLHKQLRLQNRWLAGRLSEQRAFAAAERDARVEQYERITSVLRHGHLTTVLQPVTDLRTASIVGLEALSRFAAEPSRPPDVWFAEAERVGLGVELQLLAIEHAVLALKDLPSEVFLAINLTPGVILDRERRLMALAEPVLDRLVLELTEQIPVEDYDVLNAAVAPLRAGGARLAVDDTGVGYAGLRHLIALAPDVVKLDMSLTRGVDRDPVRRALANALVHFGRETGALVVAEGVETAAELQTLRDLDVPWVQGYFIARPQSLTEVLRICDRRPGPPGPPN
ncbi:EAL domain-containing response regulator [Sporichthya polymorpha]|uniref:EAL domain-containing response regulator n=1 Tax=Sporichthya polymorpha TaxID=35751 RepID=UPI000524AF20|nr:EAL domain-containing response regulator [Sporichthya polymorpha]